ncbi:hypothetical protein [Bacteroides reticulotermitis]|uniref:hypothetical protein n=1 Tax=Bacteroides reticulotermitis TaxID=1133319 RepID=UPI001FCBD6C6|nr:hypothetical protein [Bacteroides reticulotermitis]
MKHLSLWLWIVCLCIGLQSRAQSVENHADDEFRGKRIGVIGDSYVKNHKEPVAYTWHYKFAQKHGMEYFNYGRNGNSIATPVLGGEKPYMYAIGRWLIARLCTGYRRAQRCVQIGFYRRNRTL